ILASSCRSRLLRRGWSPPRNAGRINEAQGKATDAGRSMLAWAIEAGKELIEVKRSLPHGEFQRWCEENLSFSYHAAVRYMRLAKSGTGANFDASLGIKAALEAIATKRPSAVPQLDQDTAQRVLK